jgi:spermidine/putrescine transport system permease protein
VGHLQGQVTRRARVAENHTGDGRPRVDRPYDAGRMRLGALVIPDWLLVVVVCLVPLGFIVARSLGEANPVTLDVELTGSIESYRSLFGELYRPVLVRSLTLSALTVAMCLVIGTPAALALSRLEGSARTRRLVAVVLPSFVSFTVRIFAWQGILATGGPVEGSTGLQLLYRPPAVLIGMITAYVPLFILPAYVAFARVPRALTDAAADLGASYRQQLLGITLPLGAPGIITGSIAVGVLSIGEFVVPALLGGGKVLLLGNVLADRGAGRDQPLGGAITTTMLVLFAVVGVVAWLWRRGATQRVH